MIAHASDVGARGTWQSTGTAARRRGVTGHIDVDLLARGDRAVARTSRSAALELRGPFGGVPASRFFLRNVTAGVFGGDDYRMSIRASEGVRASVAPTSATKVYASRDEVARSGTTVFVATGASLDYYAGLIILQGDADLEQRTDLVIAADAQVAYREVVAFGRVASGERLAFRRYRNHLTVSGPEGVPRYDEHCDLQPGIDRASIEVALGGYAVLGTLILTGVHAPPTLPESGDTYAGASALPNEAGWLVRVLGPRPEAVEDCLERVLRCAIPN